MNEYEEYIRQRQIERGKEYQKKKDWLMGRWKDDPENFAEEILFETEEEELKVILKDLKETNRPGYKFIKDFRLIWSFMLKQESEILAFIEAKNLYSQLEYFITICERGNKKVFRNETKGLSRKQLDEPTLATIKKNISGNGWSKLSSAFRKALDGLPKAEKKNESRIVETPKSEFERLFDPIKLETFKKLESDFFPFDWSETKQSLAALVQALITSDFFLKNLKPNTRPGRSKIRDAFEKKFTRSIKEQFKPKKIEESELKIWTQKINSRST